MKHKMHANTNFEFSPKNQSTGLDQNSLNLQSTEKTITSARQNVLPFTSLLKNIFSALPFLVFMGISLSFLISCQSKTVVSAPEKTTATDNTKQKSAQKTAAIEAMKSMVPNAIPLSSAGDNSQAKFSEDGKKIIFTSRNRTEHRNSQIYELDLKTKKERRLTHSLGDASCPIYLPANKGFVFVSETDEMKEDQHLLQNAFQTYAPDMSSAKENKDAQSGPFTELYISLNDTHEIIRLTKNSGLDSEPTIDRFSKRLIYTSERQGRLCLQQISLSGKGTPQILQKWGDDKSVEFSPAFSSDSKSVYWLKKVDADSTQIFEGTSPKQATPVFETTGHYKNPQPVPNSSNIVFSGFQPAKNQWDIYMYDRTAKCIKRLTDGSGNKLDPAVSPDQNQLVYTLQTEGNSQIFEQKFLIPEGCTSPQELALPQK